METFISLLNDAITDSGGKVPSEVRNLSRKKLLNAAWWDQDCTKVVDDRRSLLRNFKIDPSPENFLLAKSSFITSNKSLSKIKKSNFRNFISSINPDRSMIDNFHIIKKFKNRHYNSSTLNTESKSPLEDPKLTEAFDKISACYDYANLDIQDLGSGNHFLEKDISFQEVLLAIKSSKSLSAPGLDGISYSLLKKLPNSALSWLTSFYNYILSSGDYPCSWKFFKVCFIPTGGNKGFRPIALASTLLKTFERIINVVVRE